jgi:nucleotide-binding universal stress UspA family protein
MSDTRASIVVGVDDTEAGRAALAFAMTEATRRGSALDVVTAWTSRSMTEATGIDDRESDRAHAQVVQDGAVAGALRGMLRLARKAAYLVVGAGQGAFDERGSLGSVTAQCVRAARCPVLVVPRPKQRNDNRNDNRKVKQ